jgi:hypothetical protein
LYALNKQLVVLAHELRAPFVGDTYTLDAAAQQIRAAVDAEAQRQTGSAAQLEQTYELKRVQRGESPLIISLSGWDGTASGASTAVPPAAAQAYALLAGEDGVSNGLLPSLAKASAIAMGKTASAFAGLNALVTSCMPGSDYKLGLPTPKIVRLMVQDLGLSHGAHVTAEARAKMCRVPGLIKQSTRSCVAIAPWVGVRFSTSLRSLCVDLRNSLRAHGEALDDDGGGDDDDLFAGAMAAKTGDLAKTADAIPDKELDIEFDAVVHKKA